MHAIYDLKEMLCKQLEDYGKKGEMNAAVLERVDMLAHAVKNLDKIIENYEAEESGYSTGRSMARSYKDMRYDGERSTRGRRRDAMGRYSGDEYSRHGDVVGELRELMEDAPDDRTRQEIQRVVSRLEQR